MPSAHPFTPALFRFLGELAAHNERDWFLANKARYEDLVRGPAMEFVAACAPGLAKISAELVADPRPVGGSIFRIQRDVRFAKDKSPYKTHLGIQFRHARGKDAHCPGYYLHLEPGKVFLAAGIWHPDPPTARAIRGAIAADAAGWKKAAHGARFRERFALEGESLARPPAGFSPDHALLEDLKRKDFIGVVNLTQKDVTAAAFEREFLELCKRGSPLMGFLCKALDLPF